MTTTRPRLRILCARVGAACAGGLAVLVFPAVDVGPLAWVVLVPMLLVLRTAPGPGEAALRGWLGGVGCLAAVQYWLVPNLTFFFPLVVALLGLLWLPWGVLVWAVLRGRPGPRRAAAALAAVPAGWVLIETARSWQWLGGPWALLGTSQWRHPAVLGLAAVGGVWLVSFALVVANVAVVLVCVRPRTAAVVTVAGAAATAAVAAGPAWYATHPGPPAHGTVRVALVQPGVYRGAAARLEAGEALTAGLVSGGARTGRPDLVVWGESSVGYDLTSYPDVRRRLTALSRRVGAPLLVNVDAPRPGGGIAKVSVLLDGDGVVGQYAKVRLVPFGEYVPFRDQLGWLGRFTKAAGTNRERGPGPVVLRTRDGSLAVGPLISFETAFPDMARVQVGHGAVLLAYQTAMSSFQDSWAPAQMGSLGALRSAETGRPVVQAVLSGVSAAYDPRGRLLALLPADRRGVVTVDLPTVGGTTPYDRFGDWVPLLSLFLVLPALPALARSTVGRRRLRREDGSG